MPTENGRLPASLTRRIRDAGRLPWRAMSRAGRASAAGVAASAILAIALGVLIPRIAEHHTIRSRLDAMRTLVRVLEGQTLIPPVFDPLTGPAYEAFDRTVRGGLLGGENLRVKLWNREGEIVYSDDRSLVGRRFTPGAALHSAFLGSASVEVSDLSDPENVRERALADQLLEYYVPLHRGDQIVGVFEVYQDLGPLAAHMAAIRAAVWVAVGVGLTVLLAFLGFLFAATAHTLAREHQDALDRAEDLALLLTTAEILASEISTERTIPAVLRHLRDRLGLQNARVRLEGAEPEVSEAETETQACSEDAVPIRVSHERIGDLVACRQPAVPLTSREEVLLSGVAAQIGAAHESARLFRELRSVTEAKDHVLRRLVDAQERERRHLVGDLHDGLGQTLFRILYGLRGSRSRLRPDQFELREEIGRLEALVDDQSRSLRRYMATITPAVLEDFGLARALQAFVAEQRAEAGIGLVLEVQQIPDLPPATGITLFRAAQEAVMNARKHAAAEHVRISLSNHDGWVVLEVEDDGRGATTIEEGVGLTYMHDRAASLGGRVDLESRPGHGTRLIVRVPVELVGGGP